MVKKKKSVMLYIIIAILVLIITAILLLPSITNGGGAEYEEMSVTNGDVYKYVTSTSNAKVKQLKNFTATSGGEVHDIRYKVGDFVKKDMSILAVGNMYFRSDFDGYITFLNVNNGDIVVKGEPILTLVDNSELTAVLSINEVSYRYLNKNDSALISFNAIPNITYSGVVKNISSDGIISSGATLFSVYIDIDENESSNLIKNNMTCEVKIIAEKRDDVLILPVKALTFDGDKPCVITKVGKEYVKTEIELGLSDGIVVEIKSGLSVDDVVYYLKENSSRISQMMRVWGI